MLGRPNDAQRVVPIALEREHRVDHVLEHPRTGERTLLGDVADEDHRDVSLLGQAHQAMGALPHLSDGTGSGGQLGVEDRLDRVDHDDRGPKLVDMAQHPGEVGLGGQIQPLVQCAQPFGAAAHLLRGLLGRQVEHRGARTRRRGQDLEEQGRLADTRLATDERDRTRDEATAQHPIELGDAGGQWVGVERRHLGDRAGRHRRSNDDHGVGVDRLLYDRVPLATAVALARPLGSAGAALDAGVAGLSTGLRGRQGHGSEPTEHR